MKEDFRGGGCGLILGLMFRIWAEMKSNGHFITINGFYDPENPWFHEMKSNGHNINRNGFYDPEIP